VYFTFWYCPLGGVTRFRSPRVAEKVSISLTVLNAEAALELTLTDELEARLNGAESETSRKSHDIDSFVHVLAFSSSTAQVHRIRRRDLSVDVSVELASLDSCDEGVPLDVREAQLSAGRVLGVSHRYAVRG
jgi:hypothetical protein